MTQQNDEFVSFEKALRELKMQSEELKKLVSEGDIRAFRDGDSMKFRREDIDALAGGGEALVFADSLDDDTGMVTAELSADDTLLADDDVEDEAEAVTTVSPRSRQKAAAVDTAAAEQEPKWVTIAAIVCCAVMLYGFMVVYKVAMETPPSGLTAMFQK